MSSTAMLSSESHNVSHTWLVRVREWVFVRGVVCVCVCVCVRVCVCVCVCV